MAMVGVHTTTAFVQAVKESSDCLKKNIALIYEKDPFGSDSDSGHDAPGHPVANAERRPSNRPEAPSGLHAIPKEAKVLEAKKVVVRDDVEDDQNSEDESQGQNTIGDARFLNFSIDDLLRESTADFNLELCKIQVSRLFAKVRVGERVEAAKDMEQWMEFLSSAHEASEKMLVETETGSEAAQQGLEERRQDISTMVGQNSLRTSTLLKAFMQKVAQYRLETLDMLRAKYARSAYDEFWDGLQGTIDKETTRRRSKIDEEHTAAVAVEIELRTRGEHTGDPAQAPVAVNPSVAAAHMLEAISLQQDETAYRKTRLEMETGKKRQYESLLVDLVGEDSVEGQEVANSRSRLSDAEAELLVKVRGEARRAACDSILATEEGQRLAEKAGGKDLEDQNAVFFECQKLKLKAKELEKQLKNQSTPEERIKELEQQVEAKRSQLQRAAKRSERRAKMRELQDNVQPLETEDAKVPDAASLGQWLLASAPALTSTVDQVQAEYEKLRAVYDNVKEKALSERMESYGLKSGDPSKPKLEVLQQKLQESKEELQILVDEKAHLEQATGKGPKKKPKDGGGTAPDDPNLKASRAGGDAAELDAGDSQTQSASEQHSHFFNSNGEPLLESSALPDPSQFTSVGQSRPYLAELSKACQLLEKQRAMLAGKLRVANGESLEEQDHPGDAAEAPLGRARQDASNSKPGPRRGSVAAARRDAIRTDSRPMGGQKASTSTIPIRTVRKGRRAIMGALKPAEDQPEVTEEAKAGVLALLAMFKELEDLRSQIHYTDNRIHRAKLQSQDGKGGPQGEEVDDDDGAPDVNREIRREVQRKQRELNMLRKRWAEDKGNREKVGSRHAALAGSAVKYLLQDHQQAADDEASSTDSETSSSSTPTDASSKESR